jgi:AAA family ATP:ADP antiporter
MFEKNKISFSSIKNFLHIYSSDDLIKLIALALCFFIVMGSHTLIKEMKDAVFMIIVGKKYIPDIKVLSWFFMIPLVFIYSWIASRVSRHWIIVIYSLIYGLGGIVLSYFLANPEIGIYNKISDPSRLFGWIFYLFFEGHYPFTVGILWTFLSSVSQPKDVRSTYMIITIATKLGGMFFAAIAWFIASKSIYFGISNQDISSYVIIMNFASISTLIIPVLIWYLIFNVSEKNLLGYSYQQKNKNENESFCEDKNKNIASGNGSGFMLLLKNPYVLGIFGMTFFWEVVNVIFNYMRLGIALSKGSDSLTGITAFLYRDVFFMHTIGLFIVLIGTSSIVRIFGERVAIILIPILIGISISIFLCFKTAAVFVPIYMFMRAFHYAFEKPLDESLYIPTSKEIQFKSKSWIDSFGSKLSKGFGAIYNKLFQFIPLAIASSIQVFFFVFVIFSWTFLAYFLGKKWKDSVDNKKIIGS